MKIEGLEDITLAEFQELYKLNTMKMKEAIPLMREFRDKHNLTDMQALTAFKISKRIFNKGT